MRFDTLLHLKKCGFGHFCAPAGRPQISRTPMFSCLILQFCDFLESISFALACARFRMPARTRTREVRARERELPTFPKSQNREMRQENIGVRENPSRREGTQKCRINTFEKQKVCQIANEEGHQDQIDTKTHTFCFSKVLFLHFCVPSRRLGFSRTPMNLLLISRFCDFGKVESSRSRVRDFACRCEHGHGKFTHASANFQFSRNHRIAKSATNS